ncbi:MAG: hypothetical protein LBG70_02235 [Bifidobacteriaceae bacterium]|jgi:hypothetical protein|nr:hypothetical protein [Bifidobacteriaceae bacterium]
MRVVSLFREIFKDITTGTAKVTLWSCLLTLVCLGLVAWEGGTTSAILAKANNFVNSGGSVIVLEAPGFVDGRACDQLTKITNVRAAGAIRERVDGLDVAVLPGRPIPAKDATIGISQILDDNNSRALENGALISADVAQTLGLAAGSSLITRQAALLVSGIYNYPADGRRAGLGYAVVLAADYTTPFDQCWVEVWPQSSEIRSIISSVLLSGANDSAAGVAVNQLNRKYGEYFTGTVDYKTRNSQSASLVAGLFGIVIGVAMITRRRVEIAAARHLGVPTAAHILMHVFQAIFICIISMIAASPLVSWFYFRCDKQDRFAVVTDQLLVLASLTTTVVISVLLAVAIVRRMSLDRLVRRR